MKFYDSRRPPVARPSAIAPGHLLAVALLVLLIPLALPRAAWCAPGAADLDRAQQLLDAGQPEEALALLDPLPGDRTAKARALLLRSTAELMLGRQDAGRADLDRSIELDPSQRQAWLNRAGVDIADQHYDAALDALKHAQKLDPNAEDNDLNLGAVLLLQGKIREATSHFDRYLEVASNHAEAAYLMAKNYAGRGYARPAVENLRRAVDQDERYRLLARTDPAFAPISDSPEMGTLLETDSYTPPAGAHRAAERFAAAYDGGDGPLLSAVLTALREIGERFDPRVEVAPGWAVIHGTRMRIKLSDTAGASPQGGAGQAAGEGTVQGRVEISAAADAFEPQEWTERTDRLFREVRITLAERQRPDGAGDRAPDQPLPPGR